MFIPTAISPREVAHLQREGRGQRVLDVGSLLGFSTIMLSRVASSVVSIDTHQGYSGGPTLELLRSHVARYAGCPVELLVEDALVAAPRVIGSVAFVDLTGEETLTFDVISQLASSVRTVVVHDCCRPHCAGVGRAIERVSFTPIAHVDTLVELRR